MAVTSTDFAPIQIKSNRQLVSEKLDDFDCPLFTNKIRQMVLHLFIYCCPGTIVRMVPMTFYTTREINTSAQTVV
jgi:hypothetical protein